MSDGFRLHWNESGTGVEVRHFGANGEYASTGRALGSSEHRPEVNVKMRLFNGEKDK